MVCWFPLLVSFVHRGLFSKFIIVASSVAYSNHTVLVTVAALVPQPAPSESSVDGPERNVRDSF